MGFGLQLLILIICVHLKEINGDGKESCADNCLFKATLKREDACYKMSNSPDSLVFYYDPKTSSCLSSSCLHNPDVYFKLEKECAEECKSCGQLWKHYKPEDNCLKHIQIHGHRSEYSPPAPNPTYIWVFDKNIGKCVERDIYHTRLKTDWYVDEGIVVELTKEECDKKCPPV